MPLGAASVRLTEAREPVGASPRRRFCRRVPRLPERLNEIGQGPLVHVGDGDVGEVRVRPARDVVAVDRLDTARSARPRGVQRQLGVKAVDGVSFHVSPGEIVGLLGPNGAGKTTTINMILGVLEPAAGRIAIQGVDLNEDRSAALASTNFAAVYAA